MSFYARAYGLSLCADVEIPGLQALTHQPSVDVDICLQPMQAQLDEILGAAQQTWYTSPYLDVNGQPDLAVTILQGGGWFHLRYSEGADFYVEAAGKRVIGTWIPTLTLDDAVTYLLGPVMGFVLRQRGATSLHASAVTMDGRALAFVGDPGAGKSTTAARFALAGYPILSDDVVALIDRGDSFLVQPGYPRLRLWPDSVRALYGSAEALPRIIPTWDKRHLDLTQDGYQYQFEPVPLAAIYLLEDRVTGDVPAQIEPVAQHAALMALVKNTSVNYLLDKRLRAREFDALGRLVTHVHVRRLALNTNVSDPWSLSNLIRTDMTHLVTKQ